MNAHNRRRQISRLLADLTRDANELTTQINQLRPWDAETEDESWSGADLRSTLTQSLQEKQEAHKLLSEELRALPRRR